MEIYLSSFCPTPLLLSTSLPHHLPSLPQKKNLKKRERTIHANVGYLQVTYSISLFGEKYQVVFLAKTLA